MICRQLGYGRRRFVYAMSTMHESSFGADLSTDPIGSLLIGIYLAEAEGRAVGLNQIATYADVAISTATRWVAVLRQRNIIDAQADATFNLQLTRAGLDRVEAMLTTVYEAPDASIMLM